MSKYYLHVSGGSDLRLSGDSVIAAIENNFKAITQELAVGNVAGYRLHSVVAEYQTGILGGKGGIVLTIKAWGSDCLVGYEEEKDTLRTYTAWIGGAKIEDLPEPHVFEIKKEKPFDLYNDGDIDWSDDSFLYGVVWAIIDELGGEHTSMNPDKNTPRNYVAMRYPSLRRASPVKYTDRLFKVLDEFRIKNTPEADKLHVRVHDVLARISDPTKTPGPTQLLGYAATAHYFNRMRQIAGLSSARKKAGKSQSQVAQEAKISLRQYQRLESAQSDLSSASYQTVNDIARALGVRVDDLFA